MRRLFVKSKAKGVRGKHLTLQPYPSQPMWLKYRSRIFSLFRLKVDPSLCCFVALFLSFHPSQVSSQEVVTDQVSILYRQGKVFGLTSGEGISRLFLRSGEEILVMEAKGITGFVQTSRRLLGFSGPLKRFVGLNISSAEKIERWTVTPRMVVVQGREQLYGFQSNLARWKTESLGAGETVLENLVEDHVGVIITNRRVLAFSAFTGGFFSQDIPSSEQVGDVQLNDNIAVLYLSGRTLVFRSGLAIWAELH